MMLLRDSSLLMTAVINRTCRALRFYYSNRSTQAYRQLFRHFSGRIMRRPIPTFIDVAVTYRCQCKCVHCAAEAFSRPGRRELETQELISVIDQARRLGALEIVFSGGEPLLRKDIFDLVSHAHDAGLIIRLNTNGLLLDREHVSELKKAGLNQCGVSIDAPDPESHDRLRGVPGAFHKATEGIRMLREYGIYCQILTYASKDNVTSGLAGIIALGKELGVLAVFIFFPMAVGRWESDFSQVLTDEERERVRALQDLTCAHVELPTRCSICCAHAKSVLHVTAYGDVTPCPFVPYVIGNIAEHPIDVLWSHYCRDLRLECRGVCPVNYVRHREAFRDHVESVAENLGRAGPER